MRRLGVLEGGRERDDLGRALRRVHRHVLLELLLLLCSADLHVVDGAARPHLGGELLERRGVAAALVLLAVLVARGKHLERRVPAHAELVAERLAAGGAVGVGDEDLVGALEVGGELVPVGLHLLAVAAPRREEPALPAREVSEQSSARAKRRGAGCCYPGYTTTLT